MGYYGTWVLVSKLDTSRKNENKQKEKYVPFSTICKELTVLAKGLYRLRGKTMETDIPSKQILKDKPASLISEKLEFKPNLVRIKVTV